MQTTDPQTARQTGADIQFVPEAWGDPLGPFPRVLLDGRPFNLWLSERILEPLVARWPSATRSHWAESARECREAFRSVMPACAESGEPALIAAFGVAANLHRTLGCLAGLRSGRWTHTGRLDLSRLWCGLAEHAPHLPMSPELALPAAHPGLVPPDRREARHLANAIRVPAGTFSLRCAAALERLRRKGRSAVADCAAGAHPFRRTVPEGCG